jgi:MoxR-like ATPase
MHKQINQLRADLMSQFPERKDVIDGSLAAVLAGEHVLLLGPPGTAKSALVRCLAQVFGGSYFERLLTKFSTPEELFGPISLQGLAQDRFVRLTAGKLPEGKELEALFDRFLLRFDVGSCSSQRACAASWSGPSR